MIKLCMLLLAVGTIGHSGFLLAETNTTAGGLLPIIMQAGFGGIVVYMIAYDQPKQRKEAREEREQLADKVGAANELVGEVKELRSDVGELKTAITNLGDVIRGQ